jgi:hypothetical protein
VTIDGVWIGTRIYWTLWYSAWVHFTIHYYAHTHTTAQSHIFTSRCSAEVSNGWHSPSSGFPNYPRSQLPASHGSSSRLSLSSSLTDWLTDSATPPTNLTQLISLFITSRYGPHRKHFLCCCFQLLPCRNACLHSRYWVTAVEFFSYLPVIAQQRVYVPQYITVLSNIKLRRYEIWGATVFAFCLVCCYVIFPL